MVFVAQLLAPLYLATKEMTVIQLPVHTSIAVDTLTYIL